MDEKKSSFGAPDENSGLHSLVTPVVYGDYLITHSTRPEQVKNGATRMVMVSKIEDWESFYRLDADKRHEAVSYKTVMPFWVVEKIVQAHVEVHLNNAKVAVEVQNRNQTAS